ncbi:MAG: hypothetical protein ACLGHO_07420 [Gammaproteobacteria bacterium]
MPTATGKQITRVAVFGAASAFFYFLLYLYEMPIVEWTGRGGWYFLVPVGIAFVFSFVHGSFTSRFWDLLGVRARR